MTEAPGNPHAPYPTPYGQGPYGAGPGYPPPAPAPAKTNGFAIAALIFGIIGGVLLSVIFGIIALRQIRQRGQGPRPRDRRAGPVRTVARRRRGRHRRRGVEPGGSQLLR